MIADPSTTVNTKERTMATTVKGAVALTDSVDVCCPSLVAEPLATADAEDLAQVFAALSDPVRLRLLSLVAQAGEICSCDLQDPLGKAQPTISHHTKVLAEAGLLTGEKRGRWVWWRIVPERLAALRTALEVKA
jgi:ArsR family transcriptional regulator